MLDIECWMIKIAYFGSPNFSAYFLEKILTDEKLKATVEVAFVVTQPDRPAGRKQIPTPTPVKQIAKKYHLEIFEIENLNSSSESEDLKLKIKNLDLSLVYAFSQIIPKDFLSLPRLGFWNIHPSLLPRFRGPSPIAYPLILGEEETGVTIIQMDEKIDHGPIIAQKSLTIKNDDYRTDLERKLTDLSFIMFKKIVLTNFNQLKLAAQADNFATYTRLLKKDDGFIPLSTLKKVLNNQLINFEEFPAIIKEYLNRYPKEKKRFLKRLDVGRLPSESEGLMFTTLWFNIFRGLSPWPGLWTILPSGKRLKICDLKLEENKKSNVPRSTLHLTRVQLEGKKSVDFETFNRAYKIF